MQFSRMDASQFPSPQRATNNEVKKENDIEKKNKKKERKEGKERGRSIRVQTREPRPVNPGGQGGHLNEPSVFSHTTCLSHPPFSFLHSLISIITIIRT